MVKVKLSNYRVEETRMGKVIAVDVQAQGKKGKVMIHPAAMVGIFVVTREDPTEIARKALVNRVKEWAVEEGLIKETDLDAALAVLVETLVRDVKEVEI